MCVVYILVWAHVYVYMWTPGDVEYQSSFTDLHLLCWGAGCLPLEDSTSLASQFAPAISAPPSDHRNYTWATVYALSYVGVGDGQLPGRCFTWWANPQPWCCVFLGNCYAVVHTCCTALCSYACLPVLLVYFWTAAILLSMVTWV